MPSAVFVWRRFPPPFLIGGAEVSQQLLAEQLIDAGWSVRYIGSYEPPWGGAPQVDHIASQLRDWSIDCIRDERNGTLSYSWHGVACIAAPQRAIASLLSAAATDDCAVIVTSQEGSSELAREASRKAPVVGWIHSISETGTEVLRGEPNYALLTSRFVHSRIDVSGRTQPILFYPPFAAPSSSDHQATKDVLFVNPVPPKGSAVVHELAQLRRDLSFTLVEGWWDTRADFADQENVRYLPRTYAMDALYQSHSVLVVPSIVEDAFPRVIVEAAQNGLPTLAADRGGISEAVGAGGILLASDDAEVWNESLDDLLRTGERRHRSRLAREHSAQFARDCVAELTDAGVL